MAPIRTCLVELGGHVVYPKRMIILTTTIGKAHKCRTVPVNFVVVKAKSQCTMLFGQPILNVLTVVFSTYHLSFKFPTPTGVVEDTSDLKLARQIELLSQI